MLPASGTVRAGAADKTGPFCVCTGSARTPVPVERQELKITSRFLLDTEKRKWAVYFITFTIFENLNVFSMRIFKMPLEVSLEEKTECRFH